MPSTPPFTSTIWRRLLRALAAAPHLQSSLLSTTEHRPTFSHHRLRQVCTDRLQMRHAGSGSGFKERVGGRLGGWKAFGISYCLPVSEELFLVTVFEAECTFQGLNVFIALTPIAWIAHFLEWNSVVVFFCECFSSLHYHTYI